MPRKPLYTLDGKFAVEQRADAEAPLIVQLYLEGNSLSAIAGVMKRPVEYVSKCFHSDAGRAAYLQATRERAAVRDEMRTRAVYAAQAALDQIINLSQHAASENTRRLAAKDVLDIAEVGPAQVIKGGNTYNIGDEALARVCSVLKELAAPTIDAECVSMPQATT